MKVSGSIEADTININGPIAFEGLLLTPSMKINGPIVGKGDLMIGSGKINGPLQITGEINSSEFLKINGSVKAKSILGKQLVLKGKVEIEDQIEASESIELTIDSSPKLLTTAILAPLIIITKSSDGFFSRIWKLFLIGPGKLVKPIEIDTLVEGERVEYRDIINHGITAANEVIYLDRKGNQKLLERNQKNQNRSILNY